MKLSEDEKKLLRSLVQYHLKNLRSEDKLIITEDHPNFLAGEEKYEEILKEIIKKLE